MAPQPNSPHSKKAWARAADGRLRGVLVNVSGAMTRNKCRVTKTKITVPAANSPPDINGGGSAGTATVSSGTTRRSTLPPKATPARNSAAGDRIRSRCKQHWRLQQRTSQGRFASGVTFPDPLEEATLTPEKRPRPVRCEILKSGDDSGMALRSNRKKPAGTPSRNPACRKPKPTAADTTSDVKHPSPEVGRIENGEELEIEVALVGKNEAAEKLGGTEAEDAQAPIQVCDVGTTDEIDETMAQHRRQYNGTPEERVPKAVEEDEDDIDFAPDVPLDLSRSEDATPPLSPGALELRAERASPIRGPDDLPEIPRHSLRIRPKRLFKKRAVTMEFTHVVGSGGFAVCDLAVLRSTAVARLDGVRVVVKRTPKVSCPDDAPQREVAVLRRFDAASAENYFLRFFFSLERHDELLVVTEYVEGGNLASFYANHLEKITPEITRHFLAQMAVAIGVLHERYQVIHRDIKPENVCLARQGFVKLLDFGLSVAGPTCELKGGTKGYQNRAMREGLPHGYEADWYSFGASAFLLLSGCVPPPEEPRGYEMDRTSIAEADQRFILALVFGTLGSAERVLRDEWFEQVDMLAVLQVRLLRDTFNESI